MAYVIALLLIALPVEIVQDIIRRRAIPLPQRNLTRATFGAFWLTFIAVTIHATRLDPNFSIVAVGAGVIAALYLWLGIRGAQAMGVDPMSVLWWIAGALICGWLLSGFDLPRSLSSNGLLTAIFAGGLAACVVRIWLMLRPAPSATLPHPSSVPGLPMAGPAPISSAHSALSRRGPPSRPKFRT